jgi:DNA-directed RNA polymerase specialized sigma24 family protein
MRELNRESFSRLMSHLDADAEQAGRKYESLRQRLVVFFEGRLCGWKSEELADQTLDIAAMKLAEGLELREPAGLASYCYGVARYVWKDHLKRRQPEPLKADVAGHRDSAQPAQELRCLEACLETLAPDHRKLILEFYTGERRVKLDNRRQLAVNLGISSNALSQRTHAIRLRLEKCVGKCVEREL